MISLTTKVNSRTEPETFAMTYIGSAFSTTTLSDSTLDESVLTIRDRAERDLQDLMVLADARSRSRSDVHVAVDADAVIQEMNAEMAEYVVEGILSRTED